MLAAPLRLALVANFTFTPVLTGFKAGIGFAIERHKALEAKAAKANGTIVGVG